MSGVLVHEWLARRGGSENVLTELAQIFPDAPIVSLWDDAPERFAPGRVTETWLARTPLRRHKALALPLMLETWRRLGSSDADWILCSSHLFAHHARFSGPATDAPKFVYTHTPARYIWTPELDDRGDSAVARTISRSLQCVDRRRAQEAHSIAVNSAFVGRRVEKAWDRDSVVIHPPVSVRTYAENLHDLLTPDEQAVLDALPDTFILGASRFVPYKRLDVAIAAGAAAGVPVVIAGDGPEGPRLRALGEEHPGLVTFVHHPSTALLNQLYRRALLYVFPPVEDFGIMPVEAMATGTPVIANSIGGGAESVKHGVTGALVDSFEPSALRKAVDIASAARPRDCVSRAWEFDVSVFARKIREWVGG
jgi:glycosyltransferase involved in cell wall biosynthesis